MRENKSIKLRQILDKPSWKFEIIIKNGQTETRHRASMGRDFYNYLGLQLKAFQIAHSLIDLLIENNNKLENYFDIGNKFKRKPEIKKKLVKKIKSDWTGEFRK